MSLHTKLMLAITLLVALVLGGLAYAQIERVRVSMLSELEQRATLFATLLSRSLAQPLWNGDTRAIDLQLAAPFDNNEVSEIVVDALNYGVVANKIKRRPGDTANPLVRELPIEYSAFPNSPAQRIGDVRVVFSRATTDARIAEYQRAIALIAAAILVSLYIVTFLLFRRMVHGPIKRLEETVDRIAAGDMYARSQVELRDELGRLAERFNSMADRLLKSGTQLRASEARFRTFADHANDAFFLQDEQGAIIDVNRQACESLGYSREELIGRYSRDFDVGLDAASIKRLRQRVAAGETSTFETLHRHKDGSVFPVEIRSRMFEQGGLRFLSLVRDITERKRAEAALRESEEQWKAVFENNPVMYFMVGETGTILSVNPFGAEQLGYRTDELIGRPVTTVFYEPDREVVQKNAAACFERPGHPMTWELRKVRKSGEMIWVRETARATAINNRLVLLIVCEDITESKRTAEALAEVQTELAHANRVAALGQLTASIAHEVNQPIAGALSSGNAALRWLDKADLKAARRAIERVIRDTTRAGDVISDLRALVKKVPPQTETFDINEAIREVIVITRGEAEKNGIRVETQLAKDLPLVHGIRVRLQQVLMNLIINAIEAMSGVNEGPRKLLIKTAQSEPGSVSVAVRDSGPGLNPENAQRAFEAFYTTKPEGMGMGLSICRSIVEAHGQTLTVTANVPHGAIFHFTVPAHPSRAPAPRDTRRRGQSAL